MGAAKSDAGSNDGRDDRPAESGDGLVPAGRPLNFIEQIIEDDLRTNKWDGRVHTRFPPEPNGYLHIGHAKSICLNFGLAAKYGGLCNLRFDDTNPTKEEDEYVDSIQEDVRWLGFDWEDRIFYASDYFEQLYEWALQLIRDGKAYVCDLSADETREHRGTLTQPGRNSPFRDRSVQENLDLFQRMRAGEFQDGAAHVAGQDRHGLAQLEHARPGHVPHPACHAPPQRRPVVHLSDVRFHARPVRLDRTDHAFDLHAGIREPSAAVRLVLPGTGDLSPAADRVCTTQPDLHGHEQAETADAGERRTRFGLGRSAHAHDLRAAAARLHA